MTTLPHWPRLMSAEKAAGYCSMSVTMFRETCPVEPVRIDGKRRVFWDIKDLDQWIDGLRGGINHDPNYWIGVVNGENKRGRH